jgi:hypothetical protein
MPSAAGTILLDASGNAILDGDGNVMVSDGVDDCDCCGAGECGHCGSSGGRWVYLYIKMVSGSTLIFTVRGQMSDCSALLWSECAWSNGSPVVVENIDIHVSDESDGYSVSSDLLAWTTGVTTSDCSQAHWVDENLEIWLVYGATSGDVPTNPACSGGAPSPPF